jgi:chemotaxis protein methyltransferase CheR
VRLDHLNAEQFRRFRDFIYEKSGIRMPDNKLSLLSNRIRRRLTAGQWSDFDAYYKHLTSIRGAGELEFFFDAVTTNETAFFRTPAHFEWFAEDFLKGIVASARRQERSPSLRIWSAGCASGAEPYTIAICLLENMYRLQDWDLTILGTDISEEALNTAREGVFRPRAMESVTERQRKRYFRETDEGRWQVQPEVMERVTFGRHNLMMPAPTPAFDCVFIRNVLIYFDAESKEKVVRHLIRALAPGGFLVVGPSEGLYAMLDPLQRRSAFLYEKASK